MLHAIARMRASNVRVGAESVISKTWLQIRLHAINLMNLNRSMVLAFCLFMLVQYYGTFAFLNGWSPGAIAVTETRVFNVFSRLSILTPQYCIFYIVIDCFYINFFMDGRPEMCTLHSKWKVTAIECRQLLFPTLNYLAGAIISYDKYMYSDDRFSGFRLFISFLSCDWTMLTSANNVASIVSKSYSIN